MNNNRQHRISLKDLAKELGVSIATVSRALRNSPEIGAEMQQRVKDLAKKLNYRPNPFAQSLRKEAPKVIGVVVPNLVTHHYAAVLDGIEDEARRSGYSQRPHRPWSRLRRSYRSSFLIGWRRRGSSTPASASVAETISSASDRVSRRYFFHLIHSLSILYVRSC